MPGSQLEDHEGELATGGQHQAETQRVGAIEPGYATANQIDQRQFETDYQCGQQGYRAAVAGQQ